MIKIGAGKKYKPYQVKKKFTRSGEPFWNFSVADLEKDPSTGEYKVSRYINCNCFDSGIDLDNVEYIEITSILSFYFSHYFSNKYNKEVEVMNMAIKCRPVSANGNESGYNNKKREREESLEDRVYAERQKRERSMKSNTETEEDFEKIDETAEDLPF